MTTNPEYFERCKTLWRDFVPKSGQATTVQGELLRAIEKLRDEAQRNANANISNDCHRILVTFLRDTLAAGAGFDATTMGQIESDLNKLGHADRPYLDDDIYDRICARIVDWCDAQEGPVAHERNENLKC